jgi:hypothetical protein
MALETPEGLAQMVAAAVEKVKGAKPVGSKEHLEAVRELRRLLSNCQWEDPGPAACCLLGCGLSLAVVRAGARAVAAR